VTFRRAALTDVVEVARLLRIAYDRMGEVYRIPYDHESCLLSVTDAIHLGIVLLGTASTAGAVIWPFQFNHNYRIAQIRFWYLGNKREAPIFDELLRQCHEAGASLANVAAVAPEHVGVRFYERRGFYPIESHHFADLKNACYPHSKG
jgi:hypothetical protein